jgi:hypothetical protein
MREACREREDVVVGVVAIAAAIKKAGQKREGFGGREAGEMGKGAPVVEPKERFVAGAAKDAESGERIVADFAGEPWMPLEIYRRGRIAEKRNGAGKRLPVKAVDIELEQIPSGEAGGEERVE